MNNLIQYTLQFSKFSKKSKLYLGDHQFKDKIEEAHYYLCAFTDDDNNCTVVELKVWSMNSYKFKSDSEFKKLNREFVHSSWDHEVHGKIKFIEEETGKGNFNYIKSRYDKFNFKYK